MHGQILGCGGDRNVLSLDGGDDQVYEFVKSHTLGTSLVVQWLGFYTSNAGGTGLIPGWRTKIQYFLSWQKKNKKTTTKKPSHSKTDKFYCITSLNKQNKETETAP